MGGVCTLNNACVIPSKKITWFAINVVHVRVIMLHLRRGGVQQKQYTFFFFFLIYLYRPHGAALEDDWHVPFLVVQSEENALIADLGYCY